MSGSQAMSASSGPSPSPSASMSGDGSDSGTGGDQVVLTVTLGADGTFTVYPGDEPDAGEADEGDDGASGASGSDAGGQEADTVGEALKLAMGILKQAQDGAGASPDAQFQAGFAGKAAA